MKLSRLPLRWESQHPYMLVDATMREHIPGHWRSHVIAPAFLGRDTARCPLLVDLLSLPAAELGSLQEQLEEQTTQRGDTLASLLLAARPNVDLAALAKHLGKRLAIQIPGDEHPKQFRYFDPGTFVQLPRILGEQGLAWLLGPVTSAQIPWAGHWTEVLRPQAKPALLFQLSTAQIAALLRIGVVNRVAIQSPPATNAEAWIRQAEVVDAHVLRAQRLHALSHRDDLVAFAQDAWAHHPHIDDHPRMKQLFEQLRQVKPEDELDYRELRSSFQPEDWAAMAADLQQNSQEGTSP